MTFLSAEAINELGLASVGDDVLIDDAVRLIGPERITIGSHSRIDAFTILSAGEGGITIGRHVHVAAHSMYFGQARIELQDFSGLSGGTAIYSSNDDYSGRALTGPTIPDELRAVTNAPVTIGRHVIGGAGAVYLPGVTVGEGAAVGALSLVNRDVEPFAVVAGTPARRIGERSRDLLKLERALSRRSR